MNAPIVILSKPTHPGNIGATARAMKTMGLSELRLVAPHANLDEEAYQRSSHATEILDAATSYESLQEAVRDAHWVAACTARPRHIALPMFTAEEAAKQAHILLSKGEKPVFLFGSERTGLDNQDLNQCQAIVEIPTNPDYRSLNLAHAVQVLAYEFCKQPYRKTEKTRELADGLAHQHLFSHFEEVLTKLDFFPHKNPDHTMAKLMCLFNRSELGTDEIALLRGMLTNMDKHLP